MGFLKKERAPSELPGLALESSNNSNVNKISAPEIAPVTSKNVVAHIAPINNEPEPINYSRPTFPSLPRDEPVIAEPARAVHVEHKNIHHETKQEHTHHREHKVKHREEIAGEDYLEFSHKDHERIDAEEIKAKISEHIDGDEHNKLKYFDKVLDDINDGIQDLGKLEDWYENKFSSEDIVSNMKGYWEGNKADIIIQSFGSEYKRKINENVKNLQKLEEDWRAIYFQLIKKEEEMKKVEQGLKGTLSEFVDLCKRRNNGKERENK